MPDDFDALDYINRLANAAGRNVHELLAEIAKTAEAALRARLAPTTHADDEALVNDFALTLAHRWRNYGDKRDALLRRLADLRAERNSLLTQLSYADMLASNIEDRAQTAERALAECRENLALLAPVREEVDAMMRSEKDPRDA